MLKMWGVGVNMMVLDLVCACKNAWLRRTSCLLTLLTRAHTSKSGEAHRWIRKTQGTGSNGYGTS
jgi:hypothetical protein